MVLYTDLTLEVSSFVLNTSNANPCSFPMLNIPRLEAKNTSFSTATIDLLDIQPIEADTCSTWGSADVVNEN